MIDLLIDMALAALLLLAIYGYGCSIRWLVRITFWGRAADLAYSLAFGLAVVTTLLFGISLIGWLRPSVGWVLLLGGLALAVWHYQSLQSDVRAGLVALHEVWRGSWFMKAALGVFIAFIAVNLLGDLAPPLEGDTTHQYLVIPRDWVAAGGYVQPTHIWAATLPGNMMQLSAWALLLRDSYPLATLVTGFSMSLFFALGVYALARLVIGAQAAFLAVVAIYTMPDAAYLAQSAKVDMGWAFFEALALAGFFRWLQTTDRAQPARADTQVRPYILYRDSGWLILAGLCIGWAAGSKNQTFISISLLGLWIILRALLRRREQTSIAGRAGTAIRDGFVLGLPALIAALPYYLYNGIVHRSPFYPVFASQFEAWLGGTPSPRSELGTEVFYPWTPGGYFTNLWNASLGHGPDFYLGFIIGPLFLLVIPVGLALGLLRGRRTLWVMLGYALMFSVVWFLVKQAARHFLPGLTLLAVIAGYLLWRIDARQSWPRRMALLFVILGLGWNLASILGVFAWSGAHRVGLGLETRAEFLQRWHDEVAGQNVPDWETLTYLNEMLDGEDRVLTMHAANPLYARPQLVSGRWGDRISYMNIDNTDQLLGQMDEYGIDYILVYPGTLSRDVLFESPEFVAAHTDLLYDGRRAQLYRLRN